MYKILSLSALGSISLWSNRVLGVGSTVDASQVLTLVLLEDLFSGLTTVNSYVTVSLVRRRNWFPGLKSPINKPDETV